MGTDEKIAVMQRGLARSHPDNLFNAAEGEDGFRMFLDHVGAESPIEKLVLAQMFLNGWTLTDDNGRFNNAGTEGGWASIKASMVNTRYPGVFACLQVSVLLGDAKTEHSRDYWNADLPMGSRATRFWDRFDHAYRADMVLVTAADRFVIEFDGHDFHERTKEQAQRDKSRDRAMTIGGWRVLRFTGSEVYADPAGVVRQIEALTSAQPAGRP